MRKKHVIMANILLLIWFSMGMLGFSIGNHVLVQEAWFEIDGIWNLIFVGLLILFVVREKYGKYPLSAFLLIWIIAQFRVHWYYTIFGATLERIESYNRYYSNTLNLIPSSDIRIIPDLWHIVLHLFVIVASVITISYCLKVSREKRSSTKTV